jgi:hypothetical protein
MPVQRGPWLNETYREILRRAIRWGTGRAHGDRDAAHQTVSGSGNNEGKYER